MEREDIIELYDRHARELAGFFTRRTGDPQLALDLVGETFLTAFEQRRRCRAEDDRQRAAWLFRIAANKLNAHFRRGASERRATERLASQLRPLTEPELAVIGRLAEAGDEPELDFALDGLSEDQRRALALRVIDERSYHEVSQELGVSEPTARARVSRGLRALRRAMTTDGKGSANEHS
jgi:RNA polymerase sigma factor (sigma-70 family)